MGIRWDGELAHFSVEKQGSFRGREEGMGPNDCVAAKCRWVGNEIEEGGDIVNWIGENGG